jgi:integrase
MRAMRLIVKNRHGTYYAQKRVPERLQEAVALELSSDKPRQVFLSRSLGTKDLKAANVAAKAVLMDFDRVLARAEARLKARPVVLALTAAQIKRMSESYYAAVLEEDEEERREGTGSEAVFQSVAQQLKAAGIEYETPFEVGAVPEAGLSSREVYKRGALLEDTLPEATAAYARGDASLVRDTADNLLEAFQINLDRNSVSYRKLGMAVLQARVKALKDVARRNDGEPVETPAYTTGPLNAPAASGGTLHDALTGWQKIKERQPRNVDEFKRAIKMFTDLHGDLPVAEIKKGHASEFRAALLDVPATNLRRGALRTATLRELATWGHEHPEATKVAPGTVNKLIGGVQAIATFGYENGMVPDGVHWVDPFRRMKVVEEPRTRRRAFTVAELQTILDAPLFTGAAPPRGAKGAAGVWLPLLALYTGARQAELAMLRASDVRIEDDIALLLIVEELGVGKRLKTKQSERAVPVHAQLSELGFLDYVAERRREGEQAWLFPAVASDRGCANWGQWFMGYLRRTIGLTDKRLVFHTFRHTANAALIKGWRDRDIRDDLLGWTRTSMSENYSAEEMLHRWGAPLLRDAIATINYPGLDLSKVRTQQRPII